MNAIEKLALELVRKGTAYDSWPHWMSEPGRNVFRREASALLKLTLDALQEDGWKLVPVVLTPRMESAWVAAWDYAGVNGAQADHDALLAAAPAYPAYPVEGE